MPIIKKRRKNPNEPYWRFEHLKKKKITKYSEQVKYPCKVLTRYPDGFNKPNERKPKL